jgi:cardiolipin synthase
LWYFRNHRRCVLIDGQYVFTGSICIGQPTVGWIELGIFVQDQHLAERAQIIFNQTWNKVCQPTFNIGSVSRMDLKAKNDFNYITQSPLQFKRHIYKHYLKSIKNAKYTIYLVTPYFIPNRKFVRYLIEASKRQVQVHIIIPKKTEWTIVDIARNTHIKRLLSHNINIYFHKQMVHSKFALFDKSKAFIGTFNLDNLSMSYNYESAIKVLKTGCIVDLYEHIQKGLLPLSVKLDTESWNNRGLFLKALEKMVWIIRRYL